VTTNVINVDYNTKLDIKEAVRAMTGTYHILATNEHGKDEAEVEITVLSAPGKPGGPLTVSDVTKSGCKVAWKKPEDDGGQYLLTLLLYGLHIRETRHNPSRGLSAGW
jgi:hypothetical protein